MGLLKGAKGQVVGVHGRHTKRLGNKQSYTSQLQAAWTKVHLGSSGLWLLWSCLFDGGAGGVESKP